MLEVIDKGSSTESHRVPLLFVHGACGTAWCWDEHFLDFFADKGYRAVALSLRGHGASSLSKRLNSCSIADYVDDVHAVVGKLGSPPVLIGHSVGGFIVQKYLELHDARAGVLLADGVSAPTDGHARARSRFQPPGSGPSGGPSKSDSASVDQVVVTRQTSICSGMPLS